ncbi:MAG: mechanosensitive ion channel family protein [Syntrophobacterales bacterium]|nr:mechanosensitive ion channel family protein [Syntrophobacterales bacterium]
MKTFFAGYLEKSVDILIMLAIVGISMAVGYFLRRQVLGRLSRWAKKNDSPTGDIIFSAIKSPFIVLSVMMGTYLALEFSDLSKKLVDKAEQGLSILAIVAVALAAANILSGYIRMRAAKIDSRLPVTSLTENIIRITFYSVAALIILNQLGISIAPILTTLGVGGLAVALALQNTLSNFFAGFNIIVAKQIKVGDFIKLDSADSGYIEDIGWRSTTIRTLPGNYVLIPNAKLAEMIVTNYNLPENDLAVIVQLGVHYTSNLEQVEKVVREVATAVMQDAPGGVPAFEPFIRYHTFDASSINFSVIMRAQTFVDQYAITHEFIKRIHRRFAQEKIVIPFPIVALNTGQEGGAASS